MNLLALAFLTFFAMALGLHYCCPGRGQAVLLLVANAVFYLWNAPVMGLYLMASALALCSGYGAGEGQAAVAGGECSLVSGAAVLV